MLLEREHVCRAVCLVGSNAAVEAVLVEVFQIQRGLVIDGKLLGDAHVGTLRTLPPPMFDTKRVTTALFPNR
jgi:hypothetical protein